MKPPELHWTSYYEPEHKIYDAFRRNITCKTDDLRMDIAQHVANKTARKVDYFDISVHYRSPR